MGRATETEDKGVLNAALSELLGFDGTAEILDHLLSIESREVRTISYGMVPYGDVHRYNISVLNGTTLWRCLLCYDDSLKRGGESTERRRQMTTANFRMYLVPVCFMLSVVQGAYVGMYLQRKSSNHFYNPVCSGLAGIPLSTAWRWLISQSFEFCRQPRPVPTRRRIVRDNTLKDYESCRRTKRSKSWNWQAYSNQTKGIGYSCLRETDPIRRKRKLQRDKSTTSDWQHREESQPTITDTCFQTPHEQVSINSNGQFNYHQLIKTRSIYRSAARPQKANKTASEGDTKGCLRLLRYEALAFDELPVLRKNILRKRRLWLLCLLWVSSRRSHQRRSVSWLKLLLVRWPGFHRWSLTESFLLNTLYTYLMHYSHDNDKAWQQKERLLRFDRDFARRTQIIDDQADFQGTEWLSAEEEKKVKEQHEQQRLASRRPRQTLSINLWGGHWY